MPLLSLSKAFRSEKLKVISEKFGVRGILLVLFTLHFSLFTSAKPLVLPQKQAAHFCQLFVSDGGSLLPLSVHARRAIQPDDSLSVEQIFAGYVLLADGWQTMRLFPHQENGAVSWYSATETLPVSMSSEHQKYIREVFPRLIAEVQTCDWETVDAYIDRMIQYQCQFGGQKLPPRPSSAAIIGIFLLFFALLMPRMIKSLFTLGVLRKPASFNSFLLFKELANTPKGRSSEHAHNGRD